MLFFLLSTVVLGDGDGDGAAVVAKQTCKHFALLSHSTLYLLINVGLMRPYLSNHLV